MVRCKLLLINWNKTHDKESGCLFYVIQLHYYTPWPENIPESLPVKEVGTQFTRSHPFALSCYHLILNPPVRKEVGVDFTRSRPFATWLATLSASFAGSLVANPLLGLPVRLLMMLRMMIMMSLVSIFNLFCNTQYSDLGCSQLREEPHDGHCGLVGCLLFPG